MKTNNIAPEFGERFDCPTTWLETMQAILLSPADYKRIAAETKWRQLAFDGTVPGVLVTTSSKTTPGFYYRGVPVIGRLPGETN